MEEAFEPEETVRSGQQPLCPVGLATPKPGAKPTCVDLATMMRSLKELGFRFGVPANMMVGSTYEISFMIEPDKGAVDGMAETDLKVATGRIPVTSAMTADLTGADFDIKAVGADQRTVTGVTATRWAWDVTPKSGGRKPLVLEVSVHLDRQGVKEAVKIPVRRELVEVQVGWAAYMKAVSTDVTALWPTLATIFGGLGSIVVWLRSLRKTKAAPSGAATPA